MVKPHAPLIDPRSEADLAAQAQTLVEAYTSGDPALPAWKAPLPGEPPDPGAALIRVFSRFASHVVSRLNRAPELHHAAFLELIGIRRQPPRAAAVPLTFTPIPGRSGAVPVPAGTRVFPAGRPDLVFETREDLTLTHAVLDAAIVIDPGADRYSDRSDIATGRVPDSFDAFQGDSPIGHALYLSRDGVLDHPLATELSVTLESPDAAMLRALPLEWAVGDGAAWQPLGRSGEIREGLEVRLPTSGPVLRVTPGYALDGKGRTIELFHEAEIDLSTLLAGSLAADAAPTIVLLLLHWTPSGAEIAAILEEHAAGSPADVWLRLARILVTGGGTFARLEPATLEQVSGNRLNLRVLLPPARRPMEVCGRSAAWLRVRPALPHAHREGGYRVEAVTVHTTAAASGLSPDALRFNAAELDPASDFRPFGERPAPGDRFYILCDGVLRQVPGTRVEIDFTLAEALVPDAVKASPDLLLAWECWDGKLWREVGRSGVSSENARGVAGFSDTSRGFTSWSREPGGTSATLRFTLPDWIEPATIGGKVGRALRARILLGDYGAAGRAEEVVVPRSESNAGYYDLLPENALGQKIQVRWTPATWAPPVLKALSLAYSTSATPPATPEKCLAEDDFEIVDRSGAARALEAFPAFASASGADERPAFYLGFDRALPNHGLHLYLQIAPPLPGSLVEPEPGAEPPRLEWACSSSAGWSDVGVEDGTDALRARGIVRLIAPPEMAPRRVAGLNRHWLRIRWASGQYPAPVRLSRVAPDTILAENAQRRIEVLGSSTEQPELRLRVASLPVLDGAVLEVDERGAAGWQTWERVPDFYNSGPMDRHYLLDPLEGVIRFGDGRRGRMPPRGTANIRLTYRHGGGTAGNLPAGISWQSARPIPLVAGISNLDPATGGADLETPAGVAARGAATLRHGDRAVTSGDLEDLIRAMAPEVARVRVRPLRFDPLRLPVSHEAVPGAGRVRVVVLPRSQDSRPVPEVGWLRRLEVALRARAPLGLEISCLPPDWIEVSVAAVITPEDSAMGQRVRAGALEAIETFLHPLTGGYSGEGWPFGRLPHASDLHSVLAGVPGVLRLRSLSLRLRGAAPFPDEPLRDEQIEALSALHQEVLSCALVTSGIHQITFGSR